MILLCGIPSEPPLSMVAAALEELRALPVTFNQRQFAETSLEFTLASGEARGWLEIGPASYRLEDFHGVYVRLMDDRLLPELKGEQDDSPLRARCRALHDTLSLWFELCQARVVNPPSAMASNNSKPYQAQVIRRYGFEVPETLVTNDPAAALEFRREFGRVIYKSISGVRSIVHTLEDQDLDRLELIRWCPAQFQEFIDGDDVRVHVVASEVFATHIRSEAVDYRYARQQVGEPAELEEFELPHDVAARCVALAAGLDLPFAGIDLRLRPDGRWFCFEVNPSPGFSYYEANTGQPIARAVARYLVGCR